MDEQRLSRRRLLTAGAVITAVPVVTAAAATLGGADVPFMRPDALADDFTGTAAVIAHALHALRDQGDEFEGEKEGKHFGFPSPQDSTWGHDFVEKQVHNQSVEIAMEVCGANYKL